MVAPYFTVITGHKKKEFQFSSRRGALSSICRGYSLKRNYSTFEAKIKGKTSSKKLKLTNCGLVPLQ